ncbi:histidine--tRNA ligase [Acholeplasma laidlawii]|uniref:histidine--tRNA ligase n=1 Tax=Acholeplasma laidlawii TaxID=2148 RepID=UPI00084BFCA9|nr:histidine--tRNA ligase [Acholeplasma laidlawii]OED59401.1 histidine--tRNA ligase [Acholeplasma laidlawii]
MNYIKVKGTYDVLPTEAENWVALESYVRQLFKTYNYGEIRTPMMEYSNVIHRETELSDMVIKETYNFKDKSDRDLTLRPEGTAGVIRSYVENKLYAQAGVTKLYYMGPNFRYERPQKGRFRQFMQFGCEVLGSNEPSIDAEVIELAYETIYRLGLKQVSVKLNSLGDDASKANYRQALIDFLTPVKDKLSKDSQDRLTHNPLRILDSKDTADIELIKNAPLPLDYLNETSKQHFDSVLELLNLMNIPYEIDRKLVRGLDYYAHTVFEIHATIKGFGAQNALGGGGRYQNLVKELGGPDTPGIGYAFGMERLLSALEQEGITLTSTKQLDVYFITFDQQSRKKAIQLQHILRSENILSDIDHLNRGFKPQLKEALGYDSKFIIIIGENELNNNVVQLKNTKTEEQVEVSMDTLLDTLKELL